ncbi:MAG TPA: hypothetical protein PKD53_03070 [Chloroflexaceae bacterium]|nr:hypothetical protein [Chloroflexaceae bacterium]
MEHILEMSDTDIVFRPHPLGYLLRLALLLGFGLACLILALQQHPAWLTGAAVSVMLGASLAARYTAGGVIIRGVDLIVRTGTWTTREISLPVWEARPVVVQSLLGRLLDYGMVSFTIEGVTYTTHVGQLRGLLRLITSHRLQLANLFGRGALQRLRPSTQILATTQDDRW